MKLRSFTYVYFLTVLHQIMEYTISRNAIKNAEKHLKESY